MTAQLTRRSFALGSIAALGAFGLGIAGAQAAAPARADESKPDSLLIYVGAEPSSGFDPLTGGSSRLFQSKLLGFTPELKIKADLATEWEMAEDRLTYTFKLRQDVKFSDGSDLTAADVVFSFLEARDNGASTLNLTMIDDVVAEDDYTVVFTLNKPYSNFLNIVAQLGIVPAALYDAVTYRENPVGSGPFVLLQWDKGQQFIIAPNEYYYGIQSPFRQITIAFVDGEAAISNAQSGAFDVVMVSPEYATIDVPGMVLTTCETIDTRGFSLPMIPEEERDGKIVGNNVTCDIAVRRALNIGINRQAIIDGALNGIGTPATSLLAGKVNWANPESEFEDGRVDEAKAILDEAGWIEGDDGIRVKDGVRAEFDITGRTDDLQRYNLAVAFAQDARKLGIQINASAMDWATCKEINQHSPTCWGTGDYNPAGDLVAYYGSKEMGGSDRSFYANDVVDAHIQAAYDAASYEEAIEEWKMVQWDGTTGPETENGDLPCIWLASIDHTYFVREGLDLGEQIMHPHGHGWPVANNLNEWHWA